MECYLQSTRCPNVLLIPTCSIYRDEFYLLVSFSVITGVFLQVDDFVSVIDMPPVDESLWWRGKLRFQVSAWRDSRAVDPRQQSY